MSKAEARTSVPLWNSNGPIYIVNAARAERAKSSIAFWYIFVLRAPRTEFDSHTSHTEFTLGCNDNQILMDAGCKCVFLMSVFARNSTRAWRHAISQREAISQKQRGHTFTSEICESARPFSNIQKHELSPSWLAGIRFNQRSESLAHTRTSKYFDSEKRCLLKFEFWIHYFVQCFFWKVFIAYIAF